MQGVCCTLDVEALRNWCIGMSFHKSRVDVVWSFGVGDDHTVETSAHVDPGAFVQCRNKKPRKLICNPVDKTLKQAQGFLEFGSTLQSKGYAHVTVSGWIMHDVEWREL